MYIHAHYEALKFEKFWLKICGCKLWVSNENFRVECRQKKPKFVVVAMPIISEWRRFYWSDPKMLLLCTKNHTRISKMSWTFKDFIVIWFKNKTKWIWIYDREKRRYKDMKDHKKGWKNHKKAIQDHKRSCNTIKRPFKTIIGR